MELSSSFAWNIIGSMFGWASKMIGDVFRHEKTLENALRSGLVICSPERFKTINLTA